MDVDRCSLRLIDAGFRAENDHVDGVRINICNRARGRAGRHGDNVFTRWRNCHLELPDAFGEGAFRQAAGSSDFVELDIVVRGVEVEAFDTGHWTGKTVRL